MLIDLIKMKSLAPLFLVLVLAGCGDGSETTEDNASSEPRPVKSITVTQPASAAQWSYPATVLPTRTALLSFRASGQLIELPVRAAESVEKGDVIARIDPRDFESEVSRLETQLDLAKAKLIEMQRGARSEDVASLRANLDAAKARLREAQQQLDRTQQLYLREIVAKARLDQDISALEVAEAQVRAAEEELSKGQAGAREEEIAQQQAVIRGYETQVTAAEDALRDTILRAPFSGIVAKREVDNFANVQANETIVELQKLDTVDLVFDVPGPDVSDLAAREETLVSVAQIDSFPGVSFPARLVEFATRADPATQTFRGRVAITPPEGSVILPGMAGKIIITDNATEEDRFTVPSSSVSSEPDGRAFVWVVETPENSVTKRYVTMAEATGADVTVTDGLQLGDVVVTAGLSAMREDMRVRPVEKIGD